MNKYHAKKSNGFDSKREERRFIELSLLQRAGKISNLRKQVQYELIPAQRETDADGKPGKVLERAVCYVADFVYDQDGETVVEDAKGFCTKDYIIKRKLMLWVHGIRIKQV